MPRASIPQAHDLIYSPRVSSVQGFLNVAPANDVPSEGQTANAKVPRLQRECNGRQRKSTVRPSHSVKQTHLRTRYCGKSHLEISPRIGESWLDTAVYGLQHSAAVSPMCAP